MIKGAYGAGRRRIVWEREGGLISVEERAGQTGGRRITEAVPILPTFFNGIITGIGTALGLILISKISQGK